MLLPYRTLTKRQQIPVRQHPIGYCNPDVLALRLSTFYRALQKKKNTKKIGGMHSEEKRGPIILSSPSYPPPHDLTVPLEFPAIHSEFFSLSFFPPLPFLPPFAPSLQGRDSLPVTSFISIVGFPTGSRIASSLLNS